MSSSSSARAGLAAVVRQQPSLPQTSLPLLDGVKSGNGLEANYPGVAVFVAGAAAGAVSRTMTAPLNLIKLRLQTKGASSQGMKAVFTDVLSEGGARAFWRGNLANVLKIAPESAFRFGVYEQLKNALRTEVCCFSNTFWATSFSATFRLRFSLFSLFWVSGKRTDDAHREIILRFDRGRGGSGGRVPTPAKRSSFVNAFCDVCIGRSRYPLDVAKTRLAVARPGYYSGVIDCLRKTVLGEGAKGLYRGLGPALVGIMPVAGLDLAVFNSLKEVYITRERDKMAAAGNSGSATDRVNLPLHVSLGSGAVAAVAGGVLGYPLAVVRTATYMPILFWNFLLEMQR